MPMKEFDTGSGAVIEASGTENQLAPATPVAQMAGTFAEVDLNLIVSSRTNPRRTFNDESMAGLAETIKVSGVHTPILIRQLPASRVEETAHEPLDPRAAWPFGKPKGKAVRPIYEIVAGERRFRASILAGRRTIPALLRTLTDVEALEIQIIENLHRDDLSELEEAEGYQHLCETTGMSKDDVGNRINKSRRYVYGRLELLKLHTESRTALREKKIEFSHALRVARVHDPKLQAKALAFAMTVKANGDAPSVRELEVWLRQNVMLDLDKATFKITDLSLQPDAGSCKTCPKRTGADPDLFADVQNADVCTDPPCYHRKADAHRTRLVEQAKAKGMGFIEGKEALELQAGSDSFKGYAQLTQKRMDTVDGEQASLKDLLGPDGMKEVGAVVIERPGNKELVEAVPAAAAEAWLIAKGRINAGGKSTPAASVEAKIDRIRKDLDRDAKAAQAEAVSQALAGVVMSATDDSVFQLFSDDLVRGYLEVFAFDMYASNEAEAAVAMALRVPAFDREKQSSEDYDKALRAALHRASRPELVRALLLTMVDVIAPTHHDSEEHTAAKLPAHRALASTGRIDLAAINKAAAKKVADEATAKIKALEKQQAGIEKQQAAQKEAKAAKTAKPAPEVPAKPEAKAKAAPADAKPQKPAKPAKLSKGEASNKIAEAMQQTLAVGFAVTQRVTVREEAALRPTHEKWRGKSGVITSKMGDRSWDVTFKGRTGGVATFDHTELKLAADPS